MAVRDDSRRTGARSLASIPASLTINFPQNPTGRSTDQGTLGMADQPTAGKAKKSARLPWPEALAEQAQAVRAALAARPKPTTAAELAKQFAASKKVKTDRIAELLATLAALGQARRVGEERYVA